MGLQTYIQVIIKQAEGRPYSPPSLHYLRPEWTIVPIQSDLMHSHTQVSSVAPKNQQSSRLMLGQGSELLALKNEVSLVLG